jgi:D-alanyl-D-alanine-carboxypeptidase/D-alanyl-D-alanine-endopeptidase
VQTFGLNRELYPDSWNVYDSYADALLASGDRAGAIANYSKSLELNPGHEAGRERLAQLKDSP